MESIDSEESRYLISRAVKETRMQWSDQQEGENWSLDPTNEKSPIFNWEDYKVAGFKEVDFVDLRTVPEGTIIFFLGGHVNASYWALKIEREGKVKLWRDRFGKTTGLISDIDSINAFDSGSVDAATKIGNAYYGMLMASKNHRRPAVMLPYFNYHDDQVIQPKGTDLWMDEVKEIYLKSVSPV